MVSGNNVTLNDTSAIDLGGLSTISGTFNVTAGGDITDSGDLHVTALATFTVPDGSSIILDSPGNDFAGGVQFLASSGSILNLTIVSTTPIVLAGLSITGNLSVTAPGITQSGALSIGGTTFLSAAASAITLNNAANNFVGAVSVPTATNLTLVDTNAIVLGTISITGALSVTAGGAITDSGNLTIGTTTSLTAGAANDITLDNANNFGGAVTVVSGNNVTLNDTGALSITSAAVTTNFTLTAGGAVDLGPSTVGGALSVSTSGAITDSGALDIGGTTSLSPGAGNSVTLDTATNDFTGAVGMANGTNLTLVDANALVLGTISITGALSVTAGGAITDTGNLTIGTTTSLTAGAANDITLDNANNFGGAVTVVSGNNVTLNDTSAIDLGGLSTISGTFNVDGRRRHHRQRRPARHGAGHLHRAGRRLHHPGQSRKRLRRRGRFLAILGKHPEPDASSAPPRSCWRGLALPAI